MTSCHDRLARFTEALKLEMARKAGTVWGIFLVVGNRLSFEFWHFPGGVASRLLFFGKQLDVVLVKF